MMSQQLPLTPKVGEVPVSEDKYSAWSGTHGYYGRPETVQDTYKTDKMLNSRFDHEGMVNNQLLCTTMREKNKSTVEFKPSVDGDSKMLSRSTSMENFVNQRKMASLMQEKGTVENFQASFEKILSSSKLSSEKGLDVRDALFVIQDCLGDDAPEFISDKFIALCKKNSFLGKITWSQFSPLVNIVAAAVEAEITPHRELPPLMLLMTRPRIVDPDLGSLGDSSTNYRDYFNRADPLQFRDDFEGFHYREPPKDKVDTMNPAARALCSGTTKATHQLPGFRGHLPANVRNAKKAEHSSGKQEHPVQNNLRLTQRGMGCVLGYTGHVPHETSGKREERTTACDPRTSNGAAYGKTRAFL